MIYGSKFDEIMREQPSNLSVYEELGIIQAKVNESNLHLQRLHSCQPRSAQYQKPVSQPRNRPVRLR